MNTKCGLTKRNSQVQEMQQKDTSLKGLIKAMEPEIKKALPSVITPERFTRMVFTALSSTPKLQQCTPQSFRSLPHRQLRKHVQRRVVFYY